MKAFRFLLYPLAVVVSSLAWLRRALYRANFFSKMKLSVPVISVGNLTMGGTGKTPVVDFLIQHLQADGKRVALISRSYKAKKQEPRQITELTDQTAKLFGDEPSLLKLKNPLTQVFVGKSKSKVAKFFEKELSKVDVVLVDDGFQHLALHRDLNLVLFDASEKYHEVFPVGRARENFSALADADLFVLTKIETVPKRLVKKLEKFNKPILHSKMVSSFNFIGGDLPIGRDKKTRLVVFSGIANNKAFHESVRRKFQFEDSIVCEFPDHHHYSDADLRDLYQLESMDENHLTVWVCTEKDWIKISNRWSKDRKIIVGDVKFEILGSKEALDAAIRKVFN